MVNGGQASRWTQGSPDHLVDITFICIKLLNGRRPPKVTLSSAGTSGRELILKGLDSMAFSMHRPGGGVRLVMGGGGGATNAWRFNRGHS